MSGMRRTGTTQLKVKNATEEAGGVRRATGLEEKPGGEKGVCSHEARWDARRSGG